MLAQNKQQILKGCTAGLDAGLYAALEVGPVQLGVVYRVESGPVAGPDFGDIVTPLLRITHRKAGNLPGLASFALQSSGEIS